MTAAKKNTSRRKKKKKTTPIAYSTRLILSSLFLLVFVGSCLYGLVHLQHKYPERIQPSYLNEPMEEPSVQKRHTASYQEIYQLFEERLLLGSGPEGWQKLPAEGNAERFKTFAPYPDQIQLMELATEIAFANGPAQLDLAPRKGIVRLFWNGELRMALHYDVDKTTREARPLVAIIMDDMGRSLSDFKQLKQLQIPVTPAILPQGEYATKAAIMLKNAGYEYMIHIPMQPKSYPATSPGPNALLLDLNENELRKRIQHYLQRVPGAVGGNNHMGSLFTQQRDLMRIVLAEIQSEDLFFIDSKTIGTSVAFDEARKMGMRTGARQIFLDNEEDVSYIRQQIRKMVKIAEEKGEAIAICHPYRQTFEALHLEEAWLQEQQVDFVVASRVAVKR